MLFYKKRSINGLLLLDKPKGVSSNFVLQEVKNIFHAKKAGYTGTLDPLATGVLPICFGESTKFSQYLTDSDKKYSVVAKLGENTSTSDADGIIINKRPICFTSADLHSAIQECIGVIQQIPSMYSAIKYNGVPLYKYARQGLIIQRIKRTISIYKIDKLNYKDEFLSFHVFCSKGTYIRTLIEDLGEKLGCGAHVVELRRLQVALYSINQLIKMSHLYSCINKKKFSSLHYFQKLDQLLMPIDSPVSFFPQIYLSVKKAYQFTLGQKIFFISSLKNSLVRVIEKEKKKFLGIGIIDNKNYLLPHRLISTVSNVVISY